MSGPYGAWCTLKSVGPLMHPQETLCLTTFISIVLKNHKIGRPNGHAVLSSNLLTLTFFITCNHYHACYYSGQGNF